MCRIQPRAKRGIVQNRSGEEAKPSGPRYNALSRRHATRWIDHIQSKQSRCGLGYSKGKWTGSSGNPWTPHEAHFDMGVVVFAILISAAVHVIRG
jgi:hypothetical protein